MHVAVIPKTKWLENFLVKRGMVLDLREPKVLHYMGTSERILKGMIKKMKPDFVITHNQQFFKLRSVPLAYLKLSNRNEIFIPGTIYTTSVPLTREYFKRLSLQKKIIEVSKIKKQVSSPFTLGLRKGFKKTWSKFKETMLWD